MKFIIANWKMNPATDEEAGKLAEAVDVTGLIVAPPFPFLKTVRLAVKKATLGAQDLFWKDPRGAFTGEVSAAQLKSLGVEYVIIGHSERRALGETDEAVAKKVEAAMAAGLTPIFCVGENLVEREAGQTEKVIERELKIGLSLVRERLTLSVVEGLVAENDTRRLLTIAYEPIWAIGTGRPNTPEDTARVAEHIHSQLRDLSKSFIIKIIYGGSVDAMNAEAFLSNKAIDGALVGGASLDAQKIIKIIKTAERYS